MEAHMEPETTKTDGLRVYEVDDGGELVWAITDDPEKARAISREYLRGDGETDNEILEPEEILELPMDAVLEIRDDDTGELWQRTCAEWIAKSGEGFLATTCW